MSRAHKIILSHALTGFICWYGVEKVFLKSIGISTLGISLFAIIYIVISAICNVPTGILSDKYGRKYAIIGANVLLFISTLLAYYAHSFTTYLLPIITWGLFYTTQNGAYEAMLYDTLKEEDRETEYSRFSGLSHAGFWMAIFVSSVIGAWVGSRYSLRSAYLITLIPNLLNIILAYTLKEPSREQSAHHSSFSMAKQGMSFLISSPAVLYLSSVYLLISLFGWITNEFGQLFFIELGFGTLLVGLLNATSGLTQSIGNFIGHHMKHVSVKLSISVLLVLFIGSFVLPLQFRYLSITIFMILVLFRNSFFIVNDAALQKHLPSSLRSTTLSSIGIVNDCLLVVSYLTFGYIGQHHTIRAGYLAVAVYGVLILAIARLYIRFHQFAAAPVVLNPAEALIDIDSMPR